METARKSKNKDHMGQADRDCVFMLGQDLRFTWADDAARRQVGYELAELVHMHPWDIKPTFSAARFQRMIQPLRFGETDVVRFCTVHQHRRGDMMPVSVALHRLPGPGLQLLAQVRQHEDTEAMVRRATIRERNRRRNWQPMLS